MVRLRSPAEAEAARRMKGTTQTNETKVWTLPLRWPWTIDWLRPYYLWTKLYWPSTGPVLTANCAVAKDITTVQERQYAPIVDFTAATPKKVRESDDTDRALQLREGRIRRSPEVPMPTCSGGRRGVAGGGNGGR
jgi:hypothetical protein